MTGKKTAGQPQKDAKERLLDAAIKIFAIHGFEGASTRMLVKEAGVNISAIPYYFGGKEGLYEAVIEHIMSIALEKRGEKAAQIRAALDDGQLTREKGTELLHEFIRGFAAFLLSAQASPYIGQIIIREQMLPTPVFDLLYDGMMNPMHKTVTRLVAYLAGMDEDSEQAVLCAHAIFGQLAFFKTHREMALRRLQSKTYSAAQIEAITTTILRNTDAIIAAHRKAAP